MKKLILTTTLALLSLIGLQAQITTGLQAEYLLDGNTNDSQNTNNATTAGTATYETDRSGQTNSCFSFDGSTRLALPQNLTNIPEISISMWFLTETSGGLFGHNGASTSYHAPVLYIGSDGTLMGKFWDGIVGTFSTSTHTLTDSLWHHVVITADANNQKIYLDNVLVGTDPGGITSGSFLYGFIGHIQTGSWPNLPSNTFFNGLIDDVRIYDIAISDTLVNELYNTPTWTPPTYAWDLDTLYVNQNATGNNDGSSWADAYTDAREAFINTTENCEIWVTEGTYIRNSTDRNTVFGWTVDSIMVYGGFTGGETTRDNRDWNANPTIFSGDIGTVGDDSDNAYSVFAGPIGSQTYTLIDGIKITGGNSNAGSYGSTSYNGGGLSLDPLVDLIELNNIELYNNYANTGGALDFYSYTAEPTTLIMNNIIAHNNSGISAPFAHIRSSAGGKITVEMTNCLIYENEATGTISSGGDFGTVMLLGSNSGISNGIDATITNCTFANNEYVTGHFSKGMIRTYGSVNSVTSLNFTNNISFGNGIAELSNKNYANAVDAFGTVNLNNNILENSFDFVATSENNTSNADPMFNADYELLVGSPAIDSGTITGITPTSFDLAGNARISGSAIDLGCYENQCASFTPQITNASALLSASTGFTSYQWFKNGVAISGETNNTFTAIESGDYTCEINDNACIKTSNVIKIDITTVGINDLAFESVSIFPNPTNGIINLNVSEKVSSVRIMDLTGKTIKVFNAENRQLDLTALTQGIYFLEIASAEKKSVVKIIKK